jgi:hypothetical protein
VGGDLVSESNRLADLVGPFYNQDSVAGLLACPVEDLDEQARTGGLLGMATSDGVPVYPVFQFAPEGTVHRELVPVLRAFAGISGWTVAVWLRTPHDDLDDMTPEQWLAAGGDPDRVRVLAGHRAFDLSA